MSHPVEAADAYIELPDSGVVRVHPEPAALPRLRREGAGRSRFDDPDGVFAAQQVGHPRVTSPAPTFVDIEQPSLLDRLDRHPRVRAAHEASGLGTPLDPARLDAGVIRLGGPVGRPSTQAVSRAVYEWMPGADGLGYRSRLDPAERCWVIYDHVPASVTVTSLDPGRTDHREAVRAVAARHDRAISMAEAGSDLGVDPTRRHAQVVGDVLDRRQAGPIASPVPPVRPGNVNRHRASRGCHGLAPLGLSSGTPETAWGRGIVGGAQRWGVGVRRPR